MRPDPQDGFSFKLDEIDEEELDIENTEDIDDGQPTEYEEWQDYYGGDDWDQGQYEA